MNNQHDVPTNGRRLLFIGGKNGRQPFRYCNQNGVEIALPKGATFEQLARQLLDERQDLWQGLAEGEIINGNK